MAISKVTMVEYQYYNVDYNNIGSKGVKLLIKADLNQI